MKYAVLAMAAGLMAASCAPAFAMEKPRVVDGTDTISRAEYQAVADQNAAFNQCLGARFAAVRGTGDLVAIERALNTMGSITGARLEGPASVSRAQFNAEKAIFDAELARLKAKYGC